LVQQCADVNALVIARSGAQRALQILFSPSPHNRSSPFFLGTSAPLYPPD
jgi:hypothetical protein